jgi:glycosyltransferase involved in cell wall biosynthesis
MKKSGWILSVLILLATTVGATLLSSKLIEQNRLDVSSARLKTQVQSLMVLTEGMMAGRCAVISDCGNAREYVQDGTDGFLVDFPTANALVKTLELAWGSRYRWREMGFIAHRKVKALEYIAPEKHLIDIILATSPK